MLKIILNLKDKWDMVLRKEYLRVYCVDIRIVRDKFKFVYIDKLLGFFWCKNIFIIFLLKGFIF